MINTREELAEASVDDVVALFDGEDFTQNLVRRAFNQGKWSPTNVLFAKALARCGIDLQQSTRQRNNAIDWEPPGYSRTKPKQGAPPKARKQIVRKTAEPKQTTEPTQAEPTRQHESAATALLDEYGCTRNIDLEHPCECPFCSNAAEVIEAEERRFPT